MPPKPAESESLTTLLIRLTASDCLQADFSPTLILGFPGESVISISLTNTSSRPQSKKLEKRLDPEDPAEEFEIKQEIEYQHEITNPDALISPFTSDELKVSLEDAASKTKQNEESLTFDAAGLLVGIEFCNSICCVLNGFEYTAELKITVIKSRHECCRVTRFLSPSTLPVFVFKILTAEELFESPDSGWRERYLLPVRVECTLLGNTYSSEKIEETLLGNNKYSSKFDVRLNCSYACKTPEDVVILKEQLEEKEVVIKIFCRERQPICRSQDASTPKSATKEKSKPEVQESHDSICFYAFSKFSLKQLLTDRIVDQYFSLLPHYEYSENIPIISEKTQFLSATARQPTFIPAELQFDGKGKVVTQESDKQTDFETYEREPEMTPLGDWSRALVHVVAAVEEPLEQFKLEETARSDSAKASRSAKAEHPSDRDIAADSPKKPDFIHFERMYVYLYLKENEILKEILSYVGTHNIRFILKNASEEYKEQFSTEAVDDLDSYVGLLSTTCIRDAIKDADVQNLEFNYISGYRFVDKHIELLYLEASAEFDVFHDMRLILDKTHTIYKAAPAAAFRKRLFGQSPFFLEHFALYKPILYLSMKYSEEGAAVAAFMKLFNVTQNKLFPLEPIKFDLRAYQEADLFFDSDFVERMLKHFAGNIPKNSDVSVLFLVDEQREELSPYRSADNVSPSLYSFPKDSISLLGDSPTAHAISLSPNSKNGSPQRSGEETTSESPEKAEEKKIEPLRLKHPQLTEYPELVPIPKSLFEVDSSLRNRTSSKQLPQFEIKEIDNLLGTSAELKMQSARGNEVVEELASDIQESSQLRGTEVVKDVLEGKRVFLYSSQRLNKFAMHNELLTRICENKVTEIDIEVDQVQKRGELYSRERSWK